MRAKLYLAGLGAPTCSRQEASLRASPSHLPNHKYTQASSKYNSFNRFPLSTIHYQLSTIHYQLSIINYQLSIINYQLSITASSVPWERVASRPPC